MYSWMSDDLIPEQSLYEQVNLIKFVINKCMSVSYNKLQQTLYNSH